MQTLDLYYRANFVICLRYRASKRNKAKDVADLCKTATIKVLGMDIQRFYDVAVHGHAALVVLDYLAMDEAESCDMQGGGKIGKTTIGDLLQILCN